MKVMGLLAKLQGQSLEHLDLDYYTMALQFTAISRVFFYCPLLWSFPVFIFISILAYKILMFCSYTRTGNNELLWVFIHNTLKHLLHKCSHTDVEISFPRTGTEPSPRGLPQNIHILQQLLKTNEACTFLCFCFSMTITSQEWKAKEKPELKDQTSFCFSIIPLTQT